MERITIDLPIVKVKVADNYLGLEYAKEHYEVGLVLTDDGVNHNLVFYNGDGCVWSMPCPIQLFQDGVEVEAAKKERERYADVLEVIHERLDVIEKLCTDANSEMYRQRESSVKVFNALSERFDSIEGKIVSVPNSGEGVNILDVAKGFAIIQKPELIKELNKR